MQSEIRSSLTCQGITLTEAGARYSMAHDPARPTALSVVDTKSTFLGDSGRFGSSCLRQNRRPLPPFNLRGAVCFCGSGSVADSPSPLEKISPTALILGRGMRTVVLGRAELRDAHRRTPRARPCKEHGLHILTIGISQCCCPCKGQVCSL